MEKKSSSWPRFISHRGAHSTVPENTLASLRMAAELGADWVEFDVQLSQDGVVMVFHDDRLRPMINARGRISNYSADVLREFEVMDRNSRHNAKGSMPTLREWLGLAAKLQVGINIELKGSFNNHLLVEKTLSLLKECWPADLAIPLLSSFNLDTISHLSRLEQPYPYAVNLHRWPWWGLPKLIRHSSCVSVHLNYRIATKKRVQLLRDLGKVVCCYTVNDAVLAEQLFSIGVTSVFSDNINLFQ